MEEPKGIANPMLVGAMELLKEDNSSRHRDFFLQELLKAHLLTPATVTPKPEKDADGMIQMLPDSRIQVPMLSSRDGVRYFMAFTDMPELKKWIKNPEENQHVFVFGFAEFASMVKRADSQCDGFVVNPGSANIRISRQMIETIRKARATQHQDKKSENSQ